LQQQEKRMGKPFDELLEEICATRELNLDVDSAKRFLEGDKKNFVRAPVKKEIEETLTQWLQEQQ
jgi:hypothetical protein